MTLQEAEVLVLKILKQVMEEKLSSTNIEMVAVCPETGYTPYSQAQLEAIIARLP